MIICKEISELSQYIYACKKEGRPVGFVPTMGALHDGHVSLITASKAKSLFTICSIFVNPTQFNDPKDFEKYPVTIDIDIEKLYGAGCDLLFLPSVNEIYPNGTKPQKHYDIGYIENLLDGKYRPGHFQGVCQVVERLLDIVMPDELFLGQKDYQQCMVLTKLVELMNKKGWIKINICPTLREADGLAMSSRNMRLNKEERQTATTIFKALTYLKEHIYQLPVDTLQQHAHDMLTANGFKPDYVTIADATTLMPLEKIEKNTKAVALIAAFLNEVRLIDNMILTD